MTSLQGMDWSCKRGRRVPVEEGKHQAKQKPLLVPMFTTSPYPLCTHTLPTALKSFLHFEFLCCWARQSALSSYVRADCKDFGPVKFSHDITDLLTLYATSVSIRKKKVLKKFSSNSNKYCVHLQKWLASLWDQNIYLIATGSLYSFKFYTDKTSTAQSFIFVQQKELWKAPEIFAAGH